jgi:CBS domain containing-hemolysin-like protein
MSNVKAPRARLSERIAKLIQRLKNVRLRRAHAQQQEAARHQTQERLQTSNIKAQISIQVAPPERR